MVTLAAGVSSAAPEPAGEKQGGEASATEPDPEKKKAALELYGKAVGELKAERYQEAAEGFEAANELYRSANILYAAGQAWERASEPARAADAYAAALEIGDFKPGYEDKARQQLAKLTADLGRVRVESKSGARARLDEHSVFAAPVTLHGAGGPHLLHVEKPDGSQEVRKVELTPGEEKTVDVDVAPPKPKPKKKTAPPKKQQKEEVVFRPEPEPTGERDYFELGGYAGAGVGLGLLVSGVFLGLSANEAKDVYDVSPSQANFDHANNLATTTNVVFIAGGVLTAAGVGVVVWRTLAKEGPREGPDLALRILPGGVGATGRF